MSIRSLPFFAFLVWLSGCSSSVTPKSESGGGATVTPVSILLNWHPEAEHGGVFQAEADGTYTKDNLKVDIRPGGPGMQVASELELGRVQFAFANADDVVVYRSQGLDLVVVMAAMQDSPRCILVRDDSGVDSFKGLGGMTLQCQPGRPFLEFMRKRGILDRVKEVPYYGSVSSLVADKNIAIQAYSFAEPLLAEQQGVKVRRLMLSKLGWNPYASVLLTTRSMINKEPALVQRVVDASCRGWQHYMTDPTKGNELILKANEHGMTSEVLEYGAKELRALVMPDQMPLDQVGRMSLERWTTLVQQMEEIGLVPKGSVKPADCFTTEFLPKAAREASTQ